MAWEQAHFSAANSSGQRLHIRASFRAQRTLTGALAPTVKAKAPVAHSSECVVAHSSEFRSNGKLPYVYLRQLLANHQEGWVLRRWCSLRVLTRMMSPSSNHRISHPAHTSCSHPVGPCVASSDQHCGIMEIDRKGSLCLTSDMRRDSSRADKGVGVTP